MKTSIIIVDMESNLANEIAQRIIGFKQYIHFLHWTHISDLLGVIKDSKNVKGIILSGSQKNINSKKVVPIIDPEILNIGIPILGICYGMQLLSHFSGTKIVKCNDTKGENGIISFERTGAKTRLFRGTAKLFNVWMKHNWMVESLPPDWVLTGSTKLCPIAAMEKNHLFAIQFHPELYNSLWGRIVLYNFLERICKVKTGFF